MSYINTAHQGLKALERKDWDTAIADLTTGIDNSPNPAWLIGRSKAYIGVGRFREALEDADRAWHEACNRNKRELIVDAQHRRAVAYFRLGELANADCCAFFSMNMIEGGKAVAEEDPAASYTNADGFWTQTLADMKKQSAEMEDLLDGDHFRQSPERVEAIKAEAIKKKKQWRAISILRLQVLGQMEQMPADDPARKRTTTQKPPTRELANPGPPPVFDELCEEELEPSRRLAKLEEPATIVEGKPAPERAPAGEPPKELKQGEEKALTTDLKKDKEPVTKPLDQQAVSSQSASSSGLNYPTSSRFGPKNWDNLDVSSDEDEGDVNGFFKKLYKGASAEQQRAMMKSFSESGGTSLSTNWEEVKDRTVEPVPPEGVEAKKWT